MKPIIFRGFDRTKKQWVQGSLLTCERFTDIWSPQEDGQVIRTEVEPVSVGMYSGLDDVNGKQIFENDIILVQAGGKTYRNTVRFDNGAFRVWQNPTHCQPLTRQVISKYRVQVVGSVYDLINR